MKIRLLVLIIICSIFFQSCSKTDNQFKGTIEEIDGITVINNPIEPMYKEDVFELKEELIIDSRREENIDEDVIFQTIVSIDVDKYDNIYILDKKATDIKVYSSKGKFVKTIGRMGQGPGEFGNPVRLQISPNNEIYVNDSGRRSIHIFSIEGDFKKSIPASYGLFEGPEFLPSGGIIGSYAELRKEPIYKLVKFDDQMKPQIDISSIPVQRPPKVHVFVYYTASDLKWAVTPQNEIIWGVMTTPEYEIFVHNEQGEYIKKIRKEFKPIKLTKEEYEKLMIMWFGKIPEPNNWNLLIPNHYPPFQGFIVDDMGRIFVKRYVEVEKNNKHYFDVFDEGGRYIAQITLDANFQFGIFRNKKLYSIEEDNAGFQIVKRYKVSWNY